MEGQRRSTTPYVRSQTTAFFPLRFPEIGIIEDWYYDEAISGTSPLIRAVYYRKARDLAVKLRERGWGPIRISSFLRKVPKIPVPPMTVYNWIKGSKPGTTQLLITPELGYVVGTVLTDGRRTQNATLTTSDLCHARAFANALKGVTGLDYKIKWDERLKMWAVYLCGTALRYIVRENLWPIIGVIYPSHFLRALFDGDGGVGISLSSSWKTFTPVIKLTNSNKLLIRFTRWLLKEKYRIESRIYELKNQRVLCIPGTLSNLPSLKKFASEVGFSISWKQETLLDVIETPEICRTREKAVKRWRKLYIKFHYSPRKSKWVKPEWFLNPEYRWYYKEVPERIKKLLGERAALPLEHPAPL